MKREKVIYILTAALLFSIICSNSIFAQNFTNVVANSEDWRDVYSSMMYANILGKSSDFLVSTGHGSLLLSGISKDSQIEVITSKTSPFVFNYASDIKSAGFAGAEERVVDSANLELINDLEEINSFIIVGDSYGYDAIAVAPYAVLTKSWVFFADSTNILEIDSILSKNSQKKVILYGSLDPAVKNTLLAHNPEIIDTGDKFKDNIEIFEKYRKIKNSTQIILTNGEFIEKEIMSGVNPILFTGKDNVPDQIGTYLKSSDVEVGVLIGNDLVGAATNIRRSTGISVIAKFARSPRTNTGGVSVVEGLDLFYIPSPSITLMIHSVRYNIANSNLELTYHSTSNIPIYFKGTITLLSGTERTKVGDIDPIFMLQNSYKTISYPDVKLSEDAQAQIFTVYGGSPSSLDRILEDTLNISRINVIDGCEINITGVKYIKQTKSFYVSLKNTGKTDCWVSTELNNVIIDGRKKDIGSESSIKIKKGKKGQVQIKSELTEQDLSKNSFVDVTAYYGEKEDTLIKVMKRRFALKIQNLTMLTYAVIALPIIILILVILIILLRRRRKKDEEEDF